MSQQKSVVKNSIKKCTYNFWSDIIWLCGWGTKEAARVSFGKVIISPSAGLSKVPVGPRRILGKCQFQGGLLNVKIHLYCIVPQKIHKIWSKFAISGDCYMFLSKQWCIQYLSKWCNETPARLKNPPVPWCVFGTLSNPLTNSPYISRLLDNKYFLSAQKEWTTQIWHT